MTTEETSPDVCYRHPKRESWVLCQRCGRTICPECQILAPVGVQCPDCVREAGGSVTWQNAGEIRRPAAKARPAGGRSRSRSASRSPVMERLAQMLRPGDETPVLSWGIVGAVVVLALAGLFTNGLPFAFLAAAPGSSFEVWRFVTAPLVYPPQPTFLISILLSSVFFLLIAPAVERNLGRGKFAVLLVAAAVISSAAMVLAGTIGFGMTGVLFGMFGAYLIFSWSYPPARTQVLIMIGINLLISLAFGGFFLPALIGGLVAGAGVTYLFQRYESTRGTRTPYLIIAAVAAGFVVLAVLRSIAF